MTKIIEKPCATLRFAPSPSGSIHPGNSRSLVINYLLSQLLNGKFILRIDDTNTSVVQENFVQNIYHDSQWLGITYSHTFRQSERTHFYKIIFEMLAKYELIYQSDITADNLNNRIRKDAYMSSSTNFSCWRFEIKDQKIIWNDMIRGMEEHHPIKMTSDPVVFRQDGSITYLLASVIDDITMNITHIIRGRDHIPNTAIQIQMMHAILHALKLNGPIIVKDQDQDIILSYENVKPIIDNIKFAHLPLLSMTNGDKLSKRKNSMSIESLRNQGFLPMSINNYLISMGSNEMFYFKNLDEMIQYFSQKNIEEIFQHLGHSSVCFDINTLIHINQKLISDMSLNDLKKYINSSDIEWLNDKIWCAIRENITYINDIKFWKKVFFEQTLFITEQNFINFALIQDKFSLTIDQSVAKLVIQSAIRYIPEKFSNDSWHEWTKNISESTEIKGKPLFMLLRVILTNMDHGPKIGEIFEFFDKNVVMHRLKKFLDIN